MEVSILIYENKALTSHLHVVLCHKVRSVNSFTETLVKKGGGQSCSLGGFYYKTI